MLVLADDLPAEKPISADVCIVGAGAAGITLARTLAARGVSVLLLEGGGEAQSVESQDVYRGEMAHTYERKAVEYLSYSRLRFLGGTTNHWAGWVRPLDAIDFEARPWVPHSGWPFGPEALQPYYAEAAKILDVKPRFFATPDGAWAKKKPLPIDFGPQPRIRSRPFTFSPPTRFGTKFKKELQDSPRVKLVLNANVVDIHVHKQVGTVRQLLVRTFKGKLFTALARVYVLAAGGVENARLLLASRGERPAGVGNEHDVVGRYFMDHPETFFEAAGNALLTDPGLLGDEERLSRYAFPTRDPVVKRANTLNTLWLAEDLLRKEGLLQFHAHMFPAERKDVPALLGEVTRFTQGFEQGAGAKQDGALAPLKRPLILRSECAPDPDNRITLIEERDALGVPRVKLAWRLGDLEAKTHERGLQHLADAFGAQGVGRVQVLMPAGKDAAFKETGMGMHHVGTTRMHVDPKRGVVDANGRLHSVPNLYVAGSSVFPTAGGVNPTFTIVSLALRLADHLAGEIMPALGPAGGAP